MLRGKFTTEQTAMLKRLGFKATFPGDKEPAFCLFVLKIPNHTILNWLKVVVDGVSIDVKCKEGKRSISPGNEVVIFSRVFTEARLKEVLTILSTSYNP